MVPTVTLVLMYIQLFNEKISLMLGYFNKKIEFYRRKLEIDGVKIMEEIRRRAKDNIYNEMSDKIEKEYC